MDAIRYLVAGGISGRAMPSDFPAWARVYAFLRRWREHGLIAEFQDRLRGTLREREGREAEPTAGIIDAQSVRAAATGLLVRLRRLHRDITLVRADGGYTSSLAGWCRDQLALTL
ncbi:transposase [Streptomyces sp. NPDC060020]|uniref:transposase n=1 Tax=Streptomyces sp. NPDC060020 TaxID=3347038 RepID=UPI0036BAE079